MLPVLSPAGRNPIATGTPCSRGAPSPHHRVGISLGNGLAPAFPPAPAGEGSALPAPSGSVRLGKAVRLFIAAIKFGGAAGAR